LARTTAFNGPSQLLRTTLVAIQSWLPRCIWRHADTGH